MKFTVGIPAYKATYLKECIDSVLAQTYSDFELVIVNDASPENLEEIIHEYEPERIRYYKNEKNFGAVNVVDNWNKCLSYAKGDYFILMGDDDKMSIDYLDEFATLIERFPLCEVYHCRTMVINEQGFPTEFSETRPDYESVYDSILQRIKGYRLFFISDYVYRTDALKDRGGFYKLPLAWASDDISAYMGAEKHGIAHTNKPVFMYRRNALTISSGGSILIKMDAILREDEWLNTFLEKEPQGYIDSLLKENIRLEVRKFVQKKKIRTIYADTNFGMRSFLRWFWLRKKYSLSTSELLYAVLMRIKEGRKKMYEQ